MMSEKQIMRGYKQKPDLWVSLHYPILSHNSGDSEEFQRDHLGHQGRRGGDISSGVYCSALEVGHWCGLECTLCLEPETAVKLHSVTKGGAYMPR